MSLHYKEQSVKLFREAVAAFPENQSINPSNVHYDYSNWRNSHLGFPHRSLASGMWRRWVSMFWRRVLPPSSGSNRTSKKLMTAVPYFKLLLVGFSWRGPLFNPRAVRVGLLWAIFLSEQFGFPCQSLLYTDFMKSPQKHAAPAFCSSAWHRGNKRKADSVEAESRVLTVSLHNKLETCRLLRLNPLITCVCVRACVVHTPNVVAEAQILPAPSRGYNTRVPVMGQFLAHRICIEPIHEYLILSLLECSQLWLSGNSPAFSKHTCSFRLVVAPNYPHSAINTHTNCTT
jgi:hypothetical protein